MKLTFLGAAREVTGSCYLLEAAGKRILIDCGMVQGPDFHEDQKLQADPLILDGVFLTHAHIDHSGNLPLLFKNGYSGPVYAVEQTLRLCEIMLRDSAHIQQTEAEWKNRKAKRSGKAVIEPLYNMSDAEGILSLFESCDYNETVTPFPGITAVFTDAGHLLGSSSISFNVIENGEAKTIVFSGDIGNNDQPLLNDPGFLKTADYVVMESTYGDRSHGENPDYVSELTAVLNNTFSRGGDVVVPSFAVGRTQEMLYFLRQIKEEKRVAEDFTVYVDSPLAIEATGIFLRADKGYYDTEANELINAGVNPIGLPGLKTTRTSDESKQINFDKNRKVIIAASGMCEAGRIRHHLKHHLWNSADTVLFVGYQAEGTLGRKLRDGERSVKLFGEEITVNAELRTLSGISSHADREGLLCWINSFSPKPARVFVTHGQDEVVERFGILLREQGYYAAMPQHGAEYDLTLNQMLKEGAARKPRRRPQADTQFEKLRAAAERLLVLVDGMRGVANKELERLMRDINSLVDRWKQR